MTDLPDSAIAALSTADDTALLLIDHQPQMVFGARQDGAFRAAVEATGRRRLVIAGLWTEVCAAFPALSAKEAGYDVFVVVDACAGSSTAAHDAAILRMVQAGVVPVSTASMLSEWQRDWAREDTYGPVNEIVREHMGAWGQGVDYARAMLGKS